MTSKELFEKRMKLWEDAKAFLDEAAAKDETGLISAEDKEKYEKMEADLSAYDEQIELFRKREALEAKAVTEPAKGIPQSGKLQDGKGGKASAFAADGYRRAFWDNIRTKSFDRQLHNALQEGTDSEGGYVVPEDFERRLVEALDENVIFRTLATAMSISEPNAKIPIVTGRGEAAWVEEEAIIPDSDPAFGQMTISSYKLATRIKASWELVSDAFFNIEGFIAAEFGRRIGLKEEESFFTGNGVGKPTGLLNATGGAEVGKTAASQTAVTTDEIIDLIHSLRAPYRPKASFLLGDSAISSLRKLKDSNGLYLWQPALTADTPDRLFGYPMHTSAFMPNVAAGNKAILFGDYKYYWIVQRQGRIMQKLVELYAETGQVGWLMHERLDGKLILPEAVKALQLAAGA